MCRSQCTLTANLLSLQKAKVVTTLYNSNHFSNHEKSEEQYYTVRTSLTEHRN